LKEKLKKSSKKIRNNVFIVKERYGQQINNPTNEEPLYILYDQSAAGTSGGGGHGRRTDEQPADGGSGGGLLHSVEQAGSSLLRAAMSLMPTIRFVPWQPGGRGKPARRRGDHERWRTHDKNSVPDTRREGEWMPLVV
jgi:hypothetical protein